MYTRILLPLDGSDTACLAYQHAVAIARAHAATIVILHVIQESLHGAGFTPPRIYLEQVRPGFLANAQHMLDDAAAQLREHGVDVATRLVESKGAQVASCIVQEAALNGCDLVVMGTHGRRGVERLMLGSDAEAVARSSPVPVMLVRTAIAA